MYKVFIPILVGEVYQSVEEEYQVMKRGRECHVCGEEYNVEKMKVESLPSSLYY